MFIYNQTSPESIFTQRRICSVATPQGRITLSDMQLIITEQGRQEQQLASQEEYLAVLKEYFGIDLGIDTNTVL